MCRATLDKIWGNEFICLLCAAERGGCDLLWVELGSAGLRDAPSKAAAVDQNDEPDQSDDGYAGEAGDRPWWQIAHGTLNLPNPVSGATTLAWMCGSSTTNVAAVTIARDAFATVAIATSEWVVPAGGALFAFADAAVAIATDPTAAIAVALRAPRIRQYASPALARGRATAAVVAVATDSRSAVAVAYPKRVVSADRTLHACDSTPLPR